jgi:hypothetical protein
MAIRTFIYPAAQFTISGGASEAKQDEQIQIAEDTLAELQDFHADNSAENAQLTTDVQNVEAAITAQSATLDTIANAVTASFFTLPYDALQVVTKSADGPTQIVSRTGGLAGTIVQTLDITYDVDGDFESGVVS